MQTPSLTDEEPAREREYYLGTKTKCNVGLVPGLRDPSSLVLPFANLMSDLYPGFVTLRHKESCLCTIRLRSISNRHSGQLQTIAIAGV